MISREWLFHNDPNFKKEREDESVLCQFFTIICSILIMEQRDGLGFAELIDIKDYNAKNN